METAKFARQMINFQKIVFDNSFNAVTVMQNHGENMMNGFLKQFPWVTNESKKPFDDSVSFLRKTRDEYKRNVDQGFVNLEEMICAKQDQNVPKQAEKADDTKSKGTSGDQLAPVTPKIKQAARG